MTYERSDIDFHRGTFRVRGDIIDIIPVNEHANGIRIELFGDEVERIYSFDPVTGAIIQNKKSITISPASHFVTSDEKIENKSYLAYAAIIDTCLNRDYYLAFQILEYLPWLSLMKSIPFPLSFSHCLKERSDMPFLTAMATPSAVVKCSGKSARTAH